MTQYKPSGKFAVVSYSGNVGKSVIAKHLLAPRLPDAGVVAVETINEGAASNTKIEGIDFGALIEELAIQESAVVDVGASNIEVFMQKMGQYAQSHEEFDAFIVPVTVETSHTSKVWIDTANFVKALADLGVPQQRIFLIFNKVTPGEVRKLQNPTGPEGAFAPIIEFANEHPIFTYDLRMVLQESEIYSNLLQTGKTLSEVADDNTDFAALIKQAKTHDEKLMLSAQKANRRLAITAKQNLDEVFAALMERMNGSSVN